MEIFFPVYKVVTVQVSISPESTRLTYLKYDPYSKCTPKVWLLQVLEHFYAVHLQEAQKSMFALA